MIDGDKIHDKNKQIFHIKLKKSHHLLNTIIIS
jgi:hypothetical protein